MLFGSVYAAAYDSLYHDKDYAKETALLWASAERVGPPIRRVLDLGCGTGSHVVELARRGAHVTGVDRAADMLALARKKIDDAGCADRVTLIDGDVRSVRVTGEKFDLVVMAFAVLGYQTTPADAADALRTVRAHLVDGGAFVFDVWFGPAVLAQRPETREKTVNDKASGAPITRAATPRLDVLAQTVDVAYELERGGKRVVETHCMRFFFPRELELLMAAADMELVSLTSFPDGGTPDASTWNVLGVARAASRRG